MRQWILSILLLGLAGPAPAQPPAASTPATTPQPPAAQRSPFGAARARLAGALHDAAEQARHPADAMPADAAPPPAPHPQVAPQPQPTAQAALP